MTTSIDSVSDSDLAVGFEATCGNTSAYIHVPKVGSSLGLQVIIQNAAHQVWRGGGRNFANFTAALTHYKKPEVKSILWAVNAEAIGRKLAGTATPLPAATE